MADQVAHLAHLNARDNVFFRGGDEIFRTCFVDSRGGEAPAPPGAIST